MSGPGLKVSCVSNESLSTSRRGALRVLLAGLLAFAAAPALADDGGGNSGGGSGSSGDDDGDDDGDGGGDEGSKAREAVRSGEASSLKDILAVVRQKYRGQVVRVKLSGSGNRLVYNIRLLDSANRLIDIRVNAKSRRIIGAGSTVY